jgi:hypothetical protein
MPLTSREELHRVIDQMNEEQLRRVVLAIEHEKITESSAPDVYETDLSRFEGILKLSDDPSAFQDRIRGEWT